MKATTVFTLFATTLGLIAAQDLVDMIPTCAKNCLLETLGGDECGDIHNFECHCSQVSKNPRWLTYITDCLDTFCDERTQQDIKEVVKEECMNYGIDLPIFAQSQFGGMSSSSGFVARRQAVAPTKEAEKEMNEAMREIEVNDAEGRGEDVVELYPEVAEIEMAGSEGLIWKPWPWGKDN